MTLLYGVPQNLVTKLVTTTLVVVMDRVWNSRGRAGSGFGQSGSGSGRVFANFESRVRVLHCRVSGFCRVYHLCKKGAIF